jgi:hypothetical protein
MGRSTYAAGSPRLVGYLLVLGGAGLAGLSVQVALHNYRVASSMQDWLLMPGTVGGVGVIMLLVGWVMAARVHAAARLLRAGDAGRARVLETVQLGETADGRATVRVTLLVHLPGQPTYAATVKTTMSTVMLGQVQSGAIVAVRVDSRNPQRVAIDWAGARQAGG